MPSLVKINYKAFHSSQISEVRLHKIIFLPGSLPSTVDVNKLFHTPSSDDASFGRNRLGIHVGLPPGAATAVGTLFTAPSHGSSLFDFSEPTLTSTPKQNNWFGSQTTTSTAIATL